MYKMVGRLTIASREHPIDNRHWNNVILPSILLLILEAPARLMVIGQNDRADAALHNIAMVKNKPATDVLLSGRDSDAVTVQQYVKQQQAIKPVPHSISIGLDIALAATAFWLAAASTLRLNFRKKVSGPKPGAKSDTASDQPVL